MHKRCKRFLFVFPLAYQFNLISRFDALNGSGKDKFFWRTLTYNHKHYRLFC